VFGTDLAWAFTMHGNGALRTAISADGTNFVGPESTVVMPADAPREAWLATTVFPNFAGSQSFVYEWGLDGRSWWPLGPPLDNGGAAGITLFNSGAVLAVPGVFASAELRQITYEARFYTTMLFGGAIVAWPRFDTINPRQPSFTDERGRTWTINDPALIGIY
jgi:hypothetical protein